MDKIKQIEDILKELGVEYTLFRHEPVRTIEDCEKLQGLTGGLHVKNIFLTTRQKDKVFLALLCPEKKFKTADVSKQLNVSRLSFGDEEMLKEYLDIYPGAVNPFALLYDEKKAVKLVLDKDIKGMEELFFHPNDSSATVKMSYEGFEKFLKHIAVEPVFVDIA